MSLALETSIWDRFLPLNPPPAVKLQWTNSSVIRDHQSRTLEVARADFSPWCADRERSRPSLTWPDPPFVGSCWAFQRENQGKAESVELVQENVEVRKGEWCVRSGQLCLLEFRSPTDPGKLEPCSSWQLNFIVMASGSLRKDRN